MVWLNRVEAYLERLDQVASALAEQVERTQVDTRELRLEEIEAATSSIASTLRELEEQVAQREQLLSDDEAPEQGVTLTEKLGRMNDPASLRLLGRCEAVVKRVADTNHHAISLFVCQFHLANMTGEVVNILAGVAGPKTYGDSDNRMPGGNLFNESA